MGRVNEGQFRTVAGYVRGVEAGCKLLTGGVHYEPSRTYTMRRLSSMTSQTLAMEEIFGPC